MSDNNASVYTDGDKVIYRASALGGCLVALAAARQGYDPTPYPDRVLEIFERGNRAEEWYADVAHLTRRQETVELPVTSSISIRGHIDGVNNGEKIVDEVKRVNDTDWRAWTPQWLDDHPLWRKYTWQISVYMHSLGLMGRLVMVNTDFDPYRFKVYTFEKPPRTLDEIRARVFEAEATAREDELKCAVGEYFCPYPVLHQQEVVDEPELEALAAEYIRRKAIIDADSKALDNMKKQIREMLGERGKVHLLNGHSISYSEFEVKERHVAATTSRRLTVRGPK